MSIVTLRDIGEKIDALEINAFEKQFGKELPEEYKEFLIKNNGGYPIEIMFTPDFIEINPLTLEEKKQGTNVERFFSLNEVTFEYEDMLDENYIPPEYIPFARTSFGNLLLIYTGSAKEYGSIYFANHDLFDSNNNRFTISKITDSFSEFIDSLYIPDLN